VAFQVISFSHSSSSNTQTYTKRIIKVFKAPSSKSVPRDTT